MENNRETHCHTTHMARERERDLEENEYENTRES